MTARIRHLTPLSGPVEPLPIRTRAELRDDGATDHEITRQVHNGRLVTLRRGVLAPPGLNPLDAEAVAVVQALRRDAVPTIGLCFGHQLLARALGGRVERADDWGLGVGQVRFQSAEPWMHPPQGQVTLFAAHQDQVTQLPDGARLLGGSHFCPNGCYMVGDSLLGIQYHPELDRAFMRALLDHIEPHMPPGVVQRARPQIEQPVDADLFFEWMARFLEMPRKALA